MTNPQRHIWFWVIGLVVFFAILTLVSNILLPFVFGMLVAYFLDPVADKLEEWGASRTSATTLIIAFFFTVLLTIGIIVLPVLAEQFLILVAGIPQYVQHFSNTISPTISEALKDISPEALEKMQNAATDMSWYLINITGRLLEDIWHSGVALLNLLSLVFLSPVVAFYLLRDWDRMIAKIDGWLPRQNAKTIRGQLQEIDDTLAGYIRGQTNVCVLLGIFYAIGLSMVGLQAGFLIGLATGILSFIPYVGMLFGMVLGLGVAFFQFGDITHVAIVAAVFLLGQAIEGSFITPKLIGDKVNLHPVWLIFGMLAGASLFGFVGVLVAVPATAIIGVLARFSLEQYLKSSIYKGAPAKKGRKAKA